MKIYKMQVALLVMGENSKDALENAFNELEQAMEMDANICGFTIPKSAVLYKEIEEVTA